MSTTDQLATIANQLRPFVYETQAGPTISWNAVLEALGYATPEERALFNSGADAPWTSAEYRAMPNGTVVRDPGGYWAAVGRHYVKTSDATWALFFHEPTTAETGQAVAEQQNNLCPHPHGQMLVVRFGGGTHFSDCALHNRPAFPIEACNCKLDMPGFEGTREALDALTIRREGTDHV